MLTFCAFSLVRPCFSGDPKMYKKGWNSGHMVPFSHRPLLLCSHHVLATVVATKKALKWAYCFFLKCDVLTVFLHRMSTVDIVHHQGITWQPSWTGKMSTGSQPLYVLALCLWAVNSQIFPGRFMWITFIGPQRKACKKCVEEEGGEWQKYNICFCLFQLVKQSTSILWLVGGEQVIYSDQ